MKINEFVKVKEDKFEKKMLQFLCCLKTKKINLPKFLKIEISNYLISNKFFGGDKIYNFNNGKLVLQSELDEKLSDLIEIDKQIFFFYYQRREDKNTEFVPLSRARRFRKKEKIPFYVRIFFFYIFFLHFFC